MPETLPLDLLKVIHAFSNEKVVVVNLYPTGEVCPWIITNELLPQDESEVGIYESATGDNATVDHGSGSAKSIVKDGSFKFIIEECLDCSQLHDLLGSIKGEKVHTSFSRLDYHFAYSIVFQNTLKIIFISGQFSTSLMFLNYLQALPITVDGLRHFLFEGANMHFILPSGSGFDVNLPPILKKPTSCDLLHLIQRALKSHMDLLGYKEITNYVGRFALLPDNTGSIANPTFNVILFDPWLCLGKRLLGVDYLGLTFFTSIDDHYYEFDISLTIDSRSDEILGRIVRHLDEQAQETPSISIDDFVQMLVNLGLLPLSSSVKSGPDRFGGVWKELQLTHDGYSITIKSHCQSQIQALVDQYPNADEHILTEMLKKLSDRAGLVGRLCFNPFIEVGNPNL